MDEMEKEGGALLYYLADVYYPLDYMELPGNLGHSNLISCCRWTDRLNFLHLALENENLFLEIL